MVVGHYSHEALHRPTDHCQELLTCHPQLRQLLQACRHLRLQNERLNAVPHHPPFLSVCLVLGTEFVRLKSRSAKHKNQYKFLKIQFLLVHPAREQLIVSWSCYVCLNYYGGIQMSFVHRLSLLQLTSRLDRLEKWLILCFHKMLNKLNYWN